VLRPENQLIARRNVHEINRSCSGTNKMRRRIASERRVNVRTVIGCLAITIATSPLAEHFRRTDRQYDLRIDCVINHEKLR
jgi:hypothetical protein